MIWPLIFVGFWVLRLVSCSMRHEQAPAPFQGQIPLQQPFQFQMPNVDLPQGPLVERAQWATLIPDDPRPAPLLVSGPDNPRIGAVFGDLASQEMVFLAFQGDTGEPAGRIAWNTATRPIAFSLARDGSRLAVLLEERGQRASRRLRLYDLPGGEVVGKDWHPIPAVKGEIAGDLWFEMLGPDQLLTVYDHRSCDLWALPQGNRLWSVVLDGPETDHRRIAISPDRRIIAASNPAGGFTFYDTGTGELRGRTRVAHGVTKHIHSCAFSPDGLQLGCLLTVADNPAGPIWVRWSCPEGTETARWPAGLANHATYWDNEHVLIDSVPGAERVLHDTNTGKSRGSIDLANVAAMATAGQRLWYVCTSQPQRTELVSVERRLNPFRQNPARFGAAAWRLTAQGIAQDR